MKQHIIQCIFRNETTTIIIGHTICGRRVEYFDIVYWEMSLILLIKIIIHRAII